MTCAEKTARWGNSQGYLRALQSLTVNVVTENYFRPGDTMSQSGLANMVWGVNHERAVAWFWPT